MLTRTANIKAGERKARKRVLEAKLRELWGASREREELQIETQADPIDQVTSSTERDLAIQHLDQNARTMHEIQSALDKIQDGTYGLCEHCEGPIPPRRLEALPWARFCIACQSAEELVARTDVPSFKNAA